VDVLLQTNISTLTPRFQRETGKANNSFLLNEIQVLRAVSSFA